jgi:hypothetical protein
MNNKLPGTIATSPSDFENFTPLQINITNNNWKEEFDKKWDKYEFSINSSDHYDGADEDKIKEFISNLLTKKDQEHKAELEIIKGEILDCSLTVLAGYSGIEVVKEEDISSILDSHINKLSTE